MILLRYCVVSHIKQNPAANLMSISSMFKYRWNTKVKVKLQNIWQKSFKVDFAMIDECFTLTEHADAETL